MTRQERVINIAKAINAGWKRYCDFFEEVPHGTVPQLAALLELIPEDQKFWDNKWEKGESVPSRRLSGIGEEDCLQCDDPMRKGTHTCEDLKPKEKDAFPVNAIVKHKLKLAYSEGIVREIVHKPKKAALYAVQWCNGHGSVLKHAPGLLYCARHEGTKENPSTCVNCRQTIVLGLS